MPESVSGVDAILDGLRLRAMWPHGGIENATVRLTDAEAAVHAAADVPPDGEPDPAGLNAATAALAARFGEEPNAAEDAEAAVRAYLAAGRAAATPDPPDDDKRVRVTCFDPVTGESETQPLDPDNYILTLGARCEITACQVYANGTVQLTIKRGAA